MDKIAVHYNGMGNDSPEEIERKLRALTEYVNKPSVKIGGFINIVHKTMDIKNILANFITRLIGALIGIFGAWLYNTYGIDISVVITPAEVTVFAIAVGVVGSEVILPFFKRLFKAN